ncbi:MAG: bifunctional phosphopantothenoylcysteine decarboxylase/phosphopantothenate--cysteine ligase CoaBC [Myxococcales bacterium]|nr:bifunctional phosphopantothenoylcysteine decarboxylase/phosphopantothenate--cysteine ligase CoaBC [Myxococcales bacterium]
MKGTKIVLGVGGGIAAYKAVMLARELGRRGAELRVLLTPSATRFIGAPTFGGITGRAAITDLWDPGYPGEVHVELSEWADAMVIAPATANLMARVCAGMADDVVLATLSCMNGPRLLAPAMHERMWLSPATQRNAERLQKDGMQLVGPVRGPLASGESGWGRLAGAETIADAVEQAIATARAPEQARPLTGRHVVISAGPTQEDIDPVRFISNHSSGRMGFALARVAVARGARVSLVAGPTRIAPPEGAELHSVRSARDMQSAIESLVGDCHILIMSAAVADYRPAEIAEQKLKKADKGAEMRIELVKNPDILAGLGAARKGALPVLIGFAMETHDVLNYARGKLRSKGADLIVANEAAVGFGRDDTQVTLVSEENDEVLPPGSKLEAAARILDCAAERLEAAEASTTKS